MCLIKQDILMRNYSKLIDLYFDMYGNDEINNIWYSIALQVVLEKLPENYLLGKSILVYFQFDQKM